MLWLLITLLLLYPVPAFAQSTSQNLQAIVGGLIVRNAGSIGTITSLFFLTDNNSPGENNIAGQFRAVINRQWQSKPLTSVEILNNQALYDDNYEAREGRNIVASERRVGLAVNEYGDVLFGNNQGIKRTSSGGRGRNESVPVDFWWDNFYKVLYTRSASLTQIGDPSDLTLRRAAGDFPNGSPQPLDTNEGIGNINFIGWAKSTQSGQPDGFMRIQAIINARTEQALTDQAAGGSLRFYTHPIQTSDGPWERMVIGAEGDVTINGNQYTDPARDTRGRTHYLYVKGNVAAEGKFDQISDVRLKENIHTLQNPLERVLNLRGVGFEYKDKTVSKDPQIGLIAQEVEEIVPEVVSTDEKGYKSVSYQNLVPLLIEAIKNQQKQLDIQKQEIESLKGKINN